MTVKSERGRRRYIAFKVSPSLTRRALIESIPGGKTFNVIQCARGMAIVRCSPANVKECEAAVGAADPSAEPLAMSGTIRTLRDRYQVLKETAPEKPSVAAKRGRPPN